MNTIKLSKNEIFALQNFNHHPKCIGSEGEIYIYNKDRLLKFFSSTDKEFYEQKRKNIEILIKYTEVLEKLEELVLPENLVLISDDSLGLTMPLIKPAQNFYNIIFKCRIHPKTKMYYLKLVAILLEKLNHIKGFPYELRIGDLHEGNILITPNRKIKIIDLDSAYISCNEPFMQKFSCFDERLEDLNKKYTRNHNDIIIPDKNTDIYALIIMTLNALAGTEMYCLPEEEFIAYLDYLRSLGISYQFLDCINKIYTPNIDNENPIDYFDSLPFNQLKQAHHLTYKKRTGIDLLDYSI